MPDTRCRVDPISRETLAGAAVCHRVCFPETFGSRLGTDFVAASYRAFLEDPGGIGYVAVEPASGRVVGVVAGGEPGVRSRFLRRALRRFWPVVLLRGLIRPRLLVQLFRMVRGGRRGKAVPWPERQGVRFARLQVICVLPEVWGKGVAGRLLDMFRRACRKAGYDALELSVESTNARAIGFYGKTGWRVEARTPTTTVMSLDLDE